MNCIVAASMNKNTMAAFGRGRGGGMKKILFVLLCFSLRKDENVCFPTAFRLSFFQYLYTACGQLDCPILAK